MTKGTPSMGRKSGKKNMIHCRRCGKRTYHFSKRKCASCGFGSSQRLRSYAWQNRRKKI
ncbi:MAG: 50S ribosomal protein L37e [Nanoarchaeota archaeon]|nr:MAG: 50S ribosomal protein L37e [Nanoarchaeota archaeon]